MNKIANSNVLEELHCCSSITAQFAVEIDKRALHGKDIIQHPQNIDSSMFFDTIFQNQS